MNYLQPRIRKKDGRYDYTLKNGREIYPIGYCHAYQPFNDEMFPSGMAAKFNEEKEPFLSKYHEDGHSTEEEACQCYKEYLLDSCFKVEKNEDADTKHKCDLCGEWTLQTVRVGFGACHLYYLCDKHANREEVSKIFHVGTSIES